MDLFLANNTKVDGIVTVVDAVNGAATFDAQFEAVSQTAIADLIILSKTDLVSQFEVSNLENRINDLNSGARIIHSILGMGLGDQLWGLTALHEDATKQEALNWTIGKDPKFEPLTNLSGFAPAKKYLYQHQRMIFGLGLLLLFWKSLYQMPSLMFGLIH